MIKDKERRRAYRKRKRIEKNLELYGTPNNPNNPQFSRTPEETIRAYFNGHYPEWEYVGGYTNCDAKIIIRCRKCGIEIEHSYCTIRHGQKLSVCKVCLQNRRDQEAEQKALASIIREQKKVQKLIDKMETVEKPCSICGKMFIVSKSKGRQRIYCSPECQRKAANRYASKRKDHRFGKPARIHWRDLYRQTGDLTCQLCGKPCDVEDYIVDEHGTVICGDNFPSVDHIVPAALGGTDTWDNVQLAHRGCNTKKQARSPVMFLTDQASMCF